MDEIDEENEDATSNSNSSASAAAAFNLNLAPTSSSRHQSCNNTTNATPHTSHTQFPTRTSPQAHLTQRNVRNQQESKSEFQFHVFGSWLITASASQPAIIALLIFFYYSKNMNCIGALSFFKICSHVFMIFEVKLE